MKIQIVNKTEEKIKVGKQEIVSSGSVSLHSSFITDEIIEATEDEFGCYAEITKKGSMIIFSVAKDDEAENDEAPASDDADNSTDAPSDEDESEDLEELQEENDDENDDENDEAKEREVLIVEILKLGGKKPHHNSKIETVREQLSELKKG